MKNKNRYHSRLTANTRKAGRAAPSSNRISDSGSSQLDLIMGRNCIHEVLIQNPARITQVYLAESRGESHTGRKGSLRELIDSLKIPLRECSRNELDQMVQSDSHQGVVARVKPRAYISFDDLLKEAKERDSLSLLALDGVLDPQNLGAILRAAECFGVDAVLWSKNRAAPLGPVVSKVSVGASELVSLCPVPNLNRAIEALKELGVWSVGAVVAPDAKDIESFDPPNKWLLIMGSEGDGIQRLIEENLDFRVYIKMFGVISSLNVSQATAVVLHGLTRR